MEPKFKSSWIAIAALFLSATAALASDTLAYEEDADSAARLLSQTGYAQLTQGAAGLQSEEWQTLMKRFGQLGPYRDQIPGGTVFLNQLNTPSGQPVLVHARYRPHLDLPGRGALEVWLLGADSKGRLKNTGHFVFDDFLLFWHGTRPPTTQPWPHPAKQKLRIFTGQRSISDLSSLSFDYELNGVRRTLTLRLTDPDPASNQPTWPGVKVRAATVDRR